MKVRIIKSTPDRWYNDQIGMIVNVVDKGETYFGFSTCATTHYIHKSDCEILPEENQPEPFDLERALKGDIFFSKDGLTKFRVVAKSSFNEKLHILEVVRKGDTSVDLINISALNSSFYFMAPRESEYVTKWVNVYEDNGNIVIGKRPFCSFSIAKDVGTDPKESSKYIATTPITFKLPK